MLLDDIFVLEENIPLEEVLVQRKSVVVNSQGKSAAAPFLLEWNEGAGFCGVAGQVLAERGFVKPAYFTSCSEIPPQTYLALTQDNRGVTLFMALTHSGNMTSFRGDPSGIAVHLSGGTGRSTPVALVVRGDNLYQTIATGMAQALQLTGGLGHLIEDKLPPPKWFESLGWESGASLGVAVSHAGILHAVTSLREAGVNVGFVLVEEGWQDSLDNTLVSFKADAVRFPEGPKGLVRDLNRMGIKHVGVWHSLMGGRIGIHASLANKYHLQQDTQGRYFLGSDLGQAFQFFHDYYDYLREQGITFTKVGNQSNIAGFCSSSTDMTLLIKNLQAAIQAASSVQFDSFHFNTECLGNGNIFYWANSRLASAAERLDEQNPLGTMRCIRNNLFNGLWLQQFMQPDFESWMTDIPDAGMLALFHALSGTINCIGDRAGQHSKQLLKKMLLPSGKLIQADRILTPTADSVFFNPLEIKKIYKAFTRKGDCGVIGAFNLCAGRRTLQGTISPSDVDVVEGEFFAVYSHHNGFLGTVKVGECIPITLKAGECDAFTFSPVKHGVAVFGCHDFILPPGALLDVGIEEDSVHVSMLVAGPLLVYSERQVLEVRRNGHTVPWELDSKRKTLSIDARSPIIEMHATYTILFEA